MTNRSRGVTGIVLLLSALPVCAAGAVIYVDAGAAGANDGSSWHDAYNDLQDALGAAVYGQEIRVAQGLYRPDQGNGVAPGNQMATFELTDGVTVKGGYAGFGEPDPDAREVKCYATILSGDLAGNDAQVSEPCDLFAEPTRSENSEHVVTVRRTGENPAVLEGFTITGGNTAYSGAGIVIDYADVVVIDCIFIDNSAGYNGGAMSFWNSRTEFTRCSFVFNVAAKSGGAVHMDGCGTCRDSWASFRDCRFVNNRAADDGGAIFSTSNTFTTMINCLMAGNAAGGATQGSGGALHDGSYFGSSLVGCTVAGNSADDEGRAISDVDAWGGETILTNCIVYGNEGMEVGGDVVATYSDIEGGWPGEGNIDADPCFVSLGFRQAAGRWVDGNYHLLPGSPCMEGGDPDYVAEDRLGEMPTSYYFDGYAPEYTALSSEKDLDGRGRVVGERVDMGSYEFHGTPGGVIYVDADATGANDGSSWADAFNFLQDALMMAGEGDEIRVAHGVYKPDDFVLSDRPNLGRAETFQLKNGVTIRGGYAGYGEPDPNARDAHLYETILSGDLASNDANVNDPCQLLGEPSRAENSYHVVTGSGCNASAVLDGFTISGGNANGPRESPLVHCRGAGMYNNLGSPTVTRCTFRRNSAGWDGGGAYNHGYEGVCKPIFANCTFTGNWAESGGGMGNYSDGDPVLVNCTFSGNLARLGGGMRNTWCRPTVTNCTFSGNLAEFGGAMLNDESTPTVANCIFWNNGDEIWTDWAFPITYSDVQGGWPSQGNIDADPYFADADAGDYHLKSQAGRWDANKQSWVKDSVTSPCIDAGDPMGPIGYELFPNGGRVNMGAYGGTAEASKSYFGTAACETVVAGDLNGDCKVDFADFMFLALHWLEDGNL